MKLIKLTKFPFGHFGTKGKYNPGPKIKILHFFYLKRTKGK
jgi:hypothetical protein